MFLTGDIHTSWASEVTTQSSTVLAPAAVEFVVPSITSDNIDDYLGLSPRNPLSLAGAGLIHPAFPAAAVSARRSMNFRLLRYS